MPPNRAQTEVLPQPVAPSASAGRADARGRRVGTWLLALLAAGAVFRVAQYASNRSFWEDESFLVLNLRDKSAAELMGRLDNDQAAPPLFLLIERAAVVAWGANEFALRLLPLVAGLAALGLMAAVANRVAGAAEPTSAAASASEHKDPADQPAAATTAITTTAITTTAARPVAVLAAVGLFAASDRVIWRAAEVKPYGTDALAALVLTYAALAGAGRASAAARLARAAAAAAVLVWFSFPAVFVFAGISLALLPAIVGRRPAPPDAPTTLARRWRPAWRGAAAYAASNLLVAASFLGLYLTVARHQRSASLDAFWAEHFADPTRPLAFAGWLGRHLYDLCHSACEPLGPVVLALLVVGVVAAARDRRRWQSLAVLALPAAVAVAAACAKRYPFDGKRLTTFLIPGVLLLASVGFAAVVARLRAGGDRRAARAARWALPVLLTVPLGLCAYHLAFPRTRAHVRPAVEYLAARYQPGDAIYCDPHPTQLLCYWPPPGRPEVAAGPPPTSLRRLARAGADDRPPAGRFWVVIAYMPGHERRLDGLLAPARAAGTLRDRFDGYGGAAYLFEATGGPPGR